MLSAQDGIFAVWVYLSCRNFNLWASRLKAYVYWYPVDSIHIIYVRLCLVLVLLFLHSNICYVISARFALRLFQSSCKPAGKWSSLTLCLLPTSPSPGSPVTNYPRRWVHCTPWLGRRGGLAVSPLEAGGVAGWGRHSSHCLSAHCVAAPGRGGATSGQVHSLYGCHCPRGGALIPGVELSAVGVFWGCSSVVVAAAVGCAVPARCHGSGGVVWQLSVRLPQVSFCAASYPLTVKTRLVYAQHQS